MKYSKEDLNWLMDRLDYTSNRYMETENFLFEIYKMPWYKRLFCGMKIINFVKEQNNKYKHRHEII